MRGFEGTTSRSGPSARGALFLAFFSAGCTIVIDRPRLDPVTNPCDGTLPGPTANILALVRIDRTTTDLREPYGRWMETFARGLMAAGIRPTGAAMLRLDEKGDVAEPPLGVFGCEVGSTPTPAEVIWYYAARGAPEGPPRHCALSPLMAAGRDMTSLVSSWPSDLFPSAFVTRPFGAAPDILVVLEFDGGERAFGVEDAACAEASALMSTTEEGDAGWLQFAPGGPCWDEAGCPAQRGRVAMSHVFHATFATDEGLDREAFVNRCRAVEGFPLSRLDELAPSQKALYGPLAQSINAADGYARFVPLCSMLSEDRQNGILRELILDVVEGSGLELTASLLEKVLSGGSIAPELGGVAGP